MFYQSLQIKHDFSGRKVKNVIWQLTDLMRDDKVLLELLSAPRVAPASSGEGRASPDSSRITRNNAGSENGLTTCLKKSYRNDLMQKK